MCVFVCVCGCLCGVFVTLYVTCNFDVDARVCISKNTGKKLMTKQSLAESDQWQHVRTCSVQVGRLLPAFLEAPPMAVVLADAQTTAWLALASLAVVLADARPAALLAAASLAVVLADARPAALLAAASSAVVLADARPAACLALASYAVMQAPFALSLRSFALTFDAPYFCLASSLFLFSPAPPPSPRSPCPAASPATASHASRKRHFSPTFSFTFPTLPST